MQPLLETNIAFLVDNKFEDLEFYYPLLRLREAGANTVVIGKRAGEFYEGQNGYTIKSDADLSHTSSQEFAAVIIAGGFAANEMRRYEPLIRFVQQIHNSRRVVAATGYGGRVLISAGLVEGKCVTSAEAIKEELEQAGAKWVDEAAAQDENIITVRGVDDLPAFCQAILTTVGELKHMAPVDQTLEPETPEDTINLEDKVDEESWESFPASDPPANWGA